MEEGRGRREKGVAILSLDLSPLRWWISDAQNIAEFTPIIKLDTIQPIAT